MKDRISVKGQGRRMEQYKRFAVLSIAAALLAVACGYVPNPAEHHPTKEKEPAAESDAHRNLSTIIPTSEGTPPTSLYDGVGISVDVLSGGVTPGGRIIVHYNYYGCNHQGGPVFLEGLWLHRKEERRLGVWTRLGPVQRGEFTEFLQIPESTPPATDYVVTAWSQGYLNRFFCWGQSSPFPVNNEPDRLDFRIIRPSGGEQWEPGTLHYILWSFANIDEVLQDHNANVDLATAFSITRSEGRPTGWRYVDMPISGVSCYAPSSVCSMPWVVPLDMELSDRYALQIWLEHDGSRITSTDPGEFAICDDCLHRNTTPTDARIVGVQILTAEGRFNGHAEVDYYTDHGYTTIHYDARVAFDHLPPPKYCELMLETYVGRRVDGRDVFPNAWDTATPETLSPAPNVLHDGFQLPPGLTPGETIPIRANLIFGHRQLPKDAREHLDVCEPNTQNNTYDFFVTLRDAGSR
jgi:hypothetical protein